MEWRTTRAWRVDLRTRNSMVEHRSGVMPKPPELGGKIVTGHPLGERPRKGKGLPVRDPHPWNAGNNEMKDQRSATEEMLGEITAGHRRSSKRIEAERRDSNLSEVYAKIFGPGASPGVI
jgi:hypothetical protein